MALRRMLLPPGSLADLVKLIGEFDAVQFEKLLVAVSGERSFAIDDDAVDKFAGEIDIPKATLSFLVAGLSFLYERIEESDEADSDRSSAVNLVVEELKISYEDNKKKKLLIERLSRLLARNAPNKQYKKSIRLLKGFLPSATDIGSFVDIRPVLSEDKKSINGYLSIYQISITTDSDDNEQRKLVFQLNSKMLDKFATILAEVKEKDELIKSSRFVNARRLDPLS